MVGKAVRRFGRHAVDPPSKLDVVVGRYYRISQDKLPSEAPFWLKFIRVVMVSDRNRMKLTVRFPSLNSLQTADQTCSCPVLDMWFSMGVELVQTVLQQEVANPDFDDLDDFKSYWLLDTSALYPKLEHEDVSPRHPCSFTVESDDEKLDESVGNEMQLVVVKEYPCSSTADSEDEKLDESMGKERQLVVVKEEIANGDPIGDCIQKGKKSKYWSDESFEAAKTVILNIMKEKNVTADNPIFRAALRTEGRKQIGNTGLLDHLLKYIPGKIAPDGVSRFQRCYSADGLIMYWLEDADFVDAPGWKMGACTTVCPCSKELELLKEDVERIKREMEEIKKQINDVRGGGIKSGWQIVATG